MQPRRHEDYLTPSPSSKIRNQHRFDVGHGPYANSRRDTGDRSPRVQRRSLSPRAKVEGSRRLVLLGEGRSDLTERRDYGWHLGAGRNEKVCSGSPTYVQERKKPHFDDGAVHRKYEYFEDMDYDDGKSNRLKQVYGYDHHGTSSRMSKDKDYSENRLVDIDGRGMMRQKSVPVDDGMIRGSYRVPPDLVPNSNYGETIGHIPLTSQNMDVVRSEHEKLRYREPIPSGKIPARELYNEARDASYTMAPASHPKDFGSTSQFKEFAGTSSGVSRSEFPSTYREGVPLPATDEYPRSSGKLTELLDFNMYGQRSVVDTRDHEASKRIMTSYPLGAYSPKRTEHDDYLYTKSQGIVNDDHVYPSDNLQRMMSPHPRLEYEDARTDYEQHSRADYEHARTGYEHARTDYEHSELSRHNIMHPVISKTDHIEEIYGNLRTNTVWDHPTIQKQAVAENLDTGRILYASKHGGEYLGSGYAQVEFERRELRDNNTSRLGVMQDHQILHLRSDYGFGRDAGPQFQKDKLKDHPMSIYGLEMQQLAVKRHRMKEELAIYEPSHKMPKRKYIVEDDIKRCGTRTIVSSTWNESQEFEDPYDSGDEWIDKDTSGLHASRTRTYRKTKRTYDEQDHQADCTSEDWLSSQDSLAHGRRHMVRNYKPGVKYTKGHPKSGSLNWYNSHQTDRRSGIHRHHKVWKRTEDYDVDGHGNDDDPSEDWVNPTDSEPTEDSKEFKQLVDDAFLMYSKRLNLNSAVRRRYREQGKAGSLFCIVCGRSSSKEFMDTRRLVTHAFMSHKIGLRAQHLGLHKAICVLMGWSSFVPCDTITWVPEVLHDSEAMAQKEDLILWPPLVIIHNISMSNNNPEQQKVVPIEGVEALLRGKGFVGGKIKVCLGKPADQSVMLVKFLGTFTGLGNAERLHKYFAENNHGREEFDRKASNNSKISNSWEAGMQGDKLEEHLLYGYMGIAEDLDRLDFNTKKRIIVKSKKEIQDLANAPVKTDDRAADKY